MNSKARLKTIAKPFPLHDEATKLEIAKWSIHYNIKNITDRIFKMESWYMKIGKNRYDISVQEFYNIQERYLDRFNRLKSSGNRTDVIDRSLVSVYIQDDSVADSIYATMCVGKTEAMVKIISDNPEWRKSGSLESCIRTCDGDIIAGQKKYKELSRAKGYSVRIERFTDAGYDHDTAKVLLSERQRTFTLEKCINRYGEEEGRRIWQDRQDRWQNTLNSKPEEEIVEFNRKKSHSLDGYFARGMTSEEAIDRLHHLSINGYSKESIKFFKSFIPEFLLKGVKWKDNELCLYDIETNKRYYYDLEIKGVIIEYHGEVVHPNPEMLSDDEWASWKNIYNNFDADTVYAQDKLKLKIARQRGYTIFEVYSNDSQEKQQSIMNQAVLAMLSRTSIS